MRLTKEVHSNNGKRESLGGTTRTEASLSKNGPILIVKQVIALLTHSPPNSFTSWGEGGVLLGGRSLRREMMCISSFKRESAPLFLAFSFCPFGLLLLFGWPLAKQRIKYLSFYTVFLLWDTVLHFFSPVEGTRPFFPGSSTPSLLISPGVWAPTSCLGVLLVRSSLKQGPTPISWFGAFF